MLCAFVVCLSVAAAFGQTGDKLSFEVASIKPAPPQPMNQIRIGMQADGGMLRYTNVSLKECIRVAYKVKDFQIEGPDWLGSTRFDITAKFPAGATQDQVPEMLQALLTERFKLALHKDSQERPIYALVAGKNGPKLKAAEVQTDNGANAPASGPPGAGPAVRPGGQAPRGNMMLMMDPSGMHFKAASATLTQFAEAISRFTERPVQDMTGIEGQYEFDMTFTPEVTRGMPRMMGPPPGAGADRPADAPAERAESILDAVQHYGLKMEPRKSAVDILTVDHIEKTPTEN
jgi:uncharacterized protein (TIGR03435 family)